MKHTILGTLLVSVAFSLYFVDAHASEVAKLFAASKKGDAELILEIVNEGTNVDSLNINKATPLWIAVNWNKFQSVKALLMLGADPNLAAYGQTPLFRAVGRDTEIVKSLIKHGAVINTTTIKGNYSPLGRAAQSKLTIFESLKSRGSYDGPFPNILETVKILIKAGGDVNHVNSRRASPLRSAIRVNNYDVAKVLLESGADVHQTVDDTTSHGLQSGNTILMTSIFWFNLHQNLDMIELLLSNGANPNDKNALKYNEYCESCEWSGYSALTYSTDRGYHEVVKLLLTNGANPNIPRQDGKSAIEIAIEIEDQQMIEILSTE